MQQVKWIAGRYKYPVTLDYRENRIFVGFRYNKELLEEVKSMEGAKYHGFDPQPRKIWSVENSPRNHFQFQVLEGKNPYAWYDRPLVDLSQTNWGARTPYPHQIEQIQYILTYHCVIIAAEMGLGKTLSCILAMELAGIRSDEAWYVGPKAGVWAVERDMCKWKSRVWPEMFTYDRLVEHLKTYNGPAPKFIIFDESQKIKTPTAQRSKQAMHVADSMREEHAWSSVLDMLEPKWDGYIVLLTGTPAPKSPLDWWHQCEVACPGFLKEGSLPRFQRRLAFVENRENLTSGGVYPHIVTWWDDSNKCKHCGQLPLYEKHGDPGPALAMGKDVSSYHNHEPSDNEVERLYRRMKGLVLVQFKKDCTNLPDKNYEVVRVKPTPDMLRAAKLIAKRTPRAVTALTLLRELSDGFQYTEEMTGREECPNCKGTGSIKIKEPIETVDPMAPQDVKAEDFREVVVECDTCGGCGRVPTYTRGVDLVSSPKDQILFDDLDEVESIGRYVVWGGFTATIDRLVDLVHRVGWTTLRIDGRGFIGETADGKSVSANELLDCMDRSSPNYERLKEKHPKVCVVGHPEAGGIALTFTATPIELYFSNSFKGEARMQSEDRGHRLGMDENRGLLIKDIYCLSSDELVHKNLLKKKWLQNMSMGQLSDALEGNQIR